MFPVFVGNGGPAQGVLGDPAVSHAARAAQQQQQQPHQQRSRRPSAAASSSERPLTPLDQARKAHNDAVHADMQVLFAASPPATRCICVQVPWQALCSKPANSRGRRLNLQAAERRRARPFLGHMPVLQKFITPAVAARIRCEQLHGCFGVRASRPALCCGTLPQIALLHTWFTSCKCLSTCLYTVRWQQRRQRMRSHDRPQSTSSRRASQAA
jgi:hypothetical protein